MWHHKASKEIGPFRFEPSSGFEFSASPSQGSYQRHHIYNTEVQVKVMMAEKQLPLATEAPKEPPPTYEAAATQHGALPERNGPPPPGKTPLSRGLFPLDIPILNLLRGKRVILASASPRRKQILSTVNQHFLPY